MPPRRRESLHGHDSASGSWSESEDMYGSGDSASSRRRRPLSDIGEQPEYTGKDHGSLESSSNPEAKPKENETVPSSPGYFGAGPWSKDTTHTSGTMSRSSPTTRSNSFRNRGFNGFQHSNSTRNSKYTHTKPSSAADILPPSEFASEPAKPSFMGPTQSFISKTEEQMELYNKHKEKNLANLKRRQTRRTSPPIFSEPESILDGQYPPPEGNITLVPSQRKKRPSASPPKKDGPTNRTIPRRPTYTSQIIPETEVDSDEEGDREPTANTPGQQDLEIQTLRKSLQEANEDRIRLQSQNQATQQRCREKDEEIGKLKANVEALRPIHGHLRELQQTDIPRLGEELVALKQAVSEDSKNTTAYKDNFRKGKGTSDGLLIIRTSIAELLDEYVERYQELERSKDALSLQLVNQQQEHRKEVAALQGAAQSTASESPSREYDEMPELQNSFQKLYENQKKAYNSLEKKYQKLRSIRLQYDGPKLKRENEQLRDRLTALSDRYNITKENALHWQDEHKSIGERCKQSNDAYEARIKELQDEILAYIKEYHDNLPTNNPGWWEIETLQKKLKKTEGELKDWIKENERVKQQRDQAIEEFKRVRKVMERGSTIRYTSAFSGAKTKRVPRYESQEEVEKRGMVIDARRNERKKLRTDEALYEELIERARKHMMGSHYPPDKSGYTSLKKMSEWERWKVDEYLVGASEETWDLATRLGYLHAGRKKSMR